MKRFLSLKKTLALAAALAIAAPLLAFEWPAKNLDPSQSVFTFGQNRSGRFNQSIVFQNAQGAKATDKGKIIAVITEKQNDGDWFESPLGNALIIQHDDELLSVYGNLSEQSAKSLLKKSAVFDGEDLGDAAQSAWSETEESGSLEFQIVDSNSKSYINPIILMPRSAKPPKLSLDNISIENQFGRIYNLALLRSVPAGVYKVYKKRQANIVSFKSEIYVNGSEVEKITKETIKGQNGRLIISGSGDSYESSAFYPNDEMEFIGHALLPHGNNTISVTVSDIYEGSVAANFTLSGY